MFKWLTRNDGARMARAKRRIASSRASVYVEFAMIAPILALVCSALIEIVGFWDAQIMANHAAWTVGRIAMVRGSDGLAFSDNLAKKTKTGIKSEGKPKAIEKLFEDVNAVIKGFGAFNDRGNVATLMLMSTCGIGYYGSSPGKAISDTFNKLCNDGVSAIVDGLPEWVSKMVSDALPEIKLPDFMGGSDFGVSKLINELVNKIVNEIAKAVLKPIAEAIGELLKSACKEILGENGVKLDKLFASDTEAARHARQIYGAAARIVCAKKAVVTVEDMDDMKGHFMFSKYAKNKRLVYPQVADDEASSDGFFVTGAHGWPALEEGHAMVHVEINWPYESGWLFPMVSGRIGEDIDDDSNGPPVATGHSMVFPQPNIANENLYSEGATAFDPGQYSQNAGTEALDELAKQIEKYLKLVRFGMLYRIREESLSFHEGNWSWGTATRYKYCSPLADYFGIDTDDLPARGEYGECWNGITCNNDKDQNSTWDYLDDKGYLTPGSYKYRDYFKWEGTWHRRYSSATRLYYWYDDNGRWGQSYGLTYLAGNVNVYSTGGDMGWGVDERGRLVRSDHFDNLYKKYRGDLTVKRKDLRKLMSDFANRSGVNVAHIATWQGHPGWAEKDKSLYNKDKTAVNSYNTLMSFIRREAQEVQDILNGAGEYKGENGEPVLEPEDEEAIKDPAAAAKKAEAKWYTQKEKLKWKLQEIDGVINEVSTAASRYSNAIWTFKSDRKKSVSDYFIEGCFKLLIDNGNRHHIVFLELIGNVLLIVKGVDGDDIRFHYLEHLLRVVVEKQVLYGNKT